MRANGVSIDLNVFAAGMDASQGYPNFIQEWGDALLNTAAGATISVDAFESANLVFRSVRERFYMGCFRELEDAGMRSDQWDTGRRAGKAKVMLYLLERRGLV